MAVKEFNVDLDIKGKVSATNVPNSTGSIVTWNTTSKVFGLRTNAQIISDLNLSSSFVPYTGATANVDLGSRSITSTGGFIGNASTATTLATARTINGTSFNGSDNITTANWGTSRDITIGDTTKPVNGSGNVAWSLSEIGASSVSHTHPISDIVGLQTELNKIGNLPSLTTTNKTNLVAAINEVNGNTDNIEIGGRNYLLNSANVLSTTRFISVPTYYLSSLIGEEVVFSFDLMIKETGVLREIIVYPYQDSGISIENRMHFTPTQKGRYERFEFKTKIKDYGIIQGTTAGEIGFYDSTDDNDYSIKNVKLEKGNKPTDWTPAPEDQVSNWAETNSDSSSFIKGKEIVNNEFNNIYNQISSRANNRLSNLASDLTADEKRVIQDKTGAVSKTGDNVVPNSKWDNYSKGIYGYLDTDYWRIQGNLASPNNVELELATADDATEAIVVRQYSGEFASKVREAYLLDSSGNTSFPGTVTAQSFRMNGTTTTPAGVVSTESSIWQLGGDYGYGISMNAIGGLDIMANQPSQPIRLWSGQANANPYKSMEIRGSSISVYGTIFTSVHGESSQWKQAYNWGDHKAVDSHQ